MELNSVLGAIDSASLGQTLVHEHVTCADWSMRMNFGARFFDEEKVINTTVYQLIRAGERGVRTVVDGTPVNLGRDVRLMREVARRSGVNIICSSGFYYQEEPWLISRSPEELEEYLLYECHYGIQDTAIRPGVMKCAADRLGVTPLLEKLIGVTGRVASQAALPVFCHTAPVLHSGDRAIELLIENGVPPERIVAGHSGDTDDLDYLEALLRRGVYIGIDRFGMSDYTDPPYDARGIRLILALIYRGWRSRLLLSHDAAGYLAFAVGDEPCWENRREKLVFSRIHALVLPALRAAGVTQEEIEEMLVGNPRRFLEGSLNE